MPYSLEKKFEISMTKKAERVWKKREQNIKDAVNKAHIFTMQELEQEAHAMYKKLIDDYYSYKTYWYIRHEQDKPGTRTGINLYRADNIHLKKDRLFLETNYKQMSAGYRDHSRKNVLEMIKEGQRYHVGSWSGNFEGEYISVLEQDINGAFQEFENNFQRMYDAVFEKKILSLKGKYEYW